ncbi:V-type proton ATPase subunit C 1-B-like isoform X2 [Oreochromis aureus]|uniref:V-type proton ATPase subunit C 1-B-like isoform X2 n=1 Tax=Oreochromis aureus TaxID=47969 RepID=UPI0012BB9FA1|nr:V-type proton ATPase subunit C 1-B-like isoform X2 [Oreochromis aureus]
MTDFWLISVPLDKTSLTSVEKLKRTIAKTNLASSCCKFSIPDLKVGVLDSLLSVSDDLSKLDTLTESVIKKTCQCMKEVLESSDKVLENALANGVDLMNFMIKFQWDKAKYPTSLPLSSLAEIINKEVSQVEAELKSRSAAYNSVKASLQNLEHKLDGNLQTCSLNDVMRKEDLVVSEYLTTLLVVVARGSYSQWERSYESLSKFVVPRSSRKLYENGEGGVFSVTLFKRAVCEFKAKAQESKFFVRDYSFDLEEQKQREITQLSFHKKEQYVSQTLHTLSEVFFLCCGVLLMRFSLSQGIFVRWLKVNFSEVFVAWIHLKALRVFVESVLRYGLPVNYQALLLQTDRKHSKKLKEELASLFVHLDPTASITDVSCDIPGLCQQEYFSYICFHISTNVLDIS